jgi:hypothetical protein
LKPVDVDRIEQIKIEQCDRDRSNANNCERCDGMNKIMIVAMKYNQLIESDSIDEYKSIESRMPCLLQVRQGQGTNGTKFLIHRRNKKNLTE